uniref:Uncharacterized protein n=1 Tax=viral metagenome TaxID=1070528 RepID=A0A6C0ERY4_9ZZZZ
MSTISNYYKGSISLSPNSLSTICKGILKPNGSTIPDISNNYFKQLGLPIVTATFAGVNGITEKPNNLGYIYNTTDISQYCIAPYVESTGTTFTSIPTWCKNIRAILIGAGGNGATGQLGSVQQQQNVVAHHHVLHWIRNYNYRRGYGDWSNIGDSHTVIATTYNTHEGEKKHQNAIYGDSDHDTQHSRDTQHIDQTLNSKQAAGSSGGGGGGGGFVYLNNIQVEGKTISIAGGGLLQDTTLTVQTTKYTAAKGLNAPGITAGTGGAVTGTATASGAGNAGSASTGGTSGFYSYLNTFQYGNGGNGGAGGVSGTNPDPSDGIPGQAGYYRIYFLTD